MNRMLFLWENLGPGHFDRLAALAAAVPEVEVVGIQATARSHTYDWVAAGAPGVVVRTLCPAGRATGWRRAWRLLRLCLEARRAPVFLCHYEEWPVALVALLLRLAGRRVFAMTDSKEDDYPRFWWRELGKAVVLLPYRGALTASPRSRDYLRFLGFHRRPVLLGYDSLSTARIARQADRPAAPGGTPFAERDFLVVARLIPKKNVLMAIQAYARWRTLTGGTRLLHLCGGGPEEARLRAAAAALGVADGVRFHGFVQSPEVSRQFARALCLLLPSVEEQFGLVVVEAQAMGVPVLLSARAGAADQLLVPGHDGFLIDPAKPEACAALMAHLSEDEAGWRRMAANAWAGRERGDARHFAAAALALAMGELPG